MTKCSEQQFMGNWHLGLGLVFAVSTAHNVMRFMATWRLRNAANAALYAGLTLYEIDQAKGHWTATS